ncbi:MAG: hypothetical protein K8T91_18070, partial [Planctomycetes bacterium]|nr:hypothetical protein [Planctomycetota bacterium]
LSVEGDAGVVDAASLNRVIQVPADQRQTELAVDLPTQAARGKVDLRVALSYFYCQDKTGVCKAGSVVWLVPVQVTPDGPADEVLLEHAVEP